MLEQQIKTTFTQILKEELVPAMGCTEPISLAYAAALTRKHLGDLPDVVDVTVCGNIIKNVKSVIVPHTGGLRGIETAVAAGFVVGDPESELEVLSKVQDEQLPQIRHFLLHRTINVQQSQSDKLFEIIIKARNSEHNVTVAITDGHTNVTLIEKDGQVIFASQEKNDENQHTDRSLLNVERILQYAKEVDLNDVKETLDRQINYNMAIAEEGLKGNYGASIGKVLLLANGNNVANRAKAYAAAGSDARMNGCELPVVINSGSGNQGLTASLPVIIYSKELNVSQEELYRALIISNLVTIHLKTGIGPLSAYCGATSAGCGATAGITYLYGGGYSEIAHTIVNSVAINSGVVCDGAKASCAAKIASAIEAGLLGMQMYMHGKEFIGGDGIVTKDIEKTIENVSQLARVGMKETDKEILKIMMNC